MNNIYLIKKDLNLIKLTSYSYFIHDENKFSKEEKKILIINS
jgi:hypothetical protein